MTEQLREILDTVHEKDFCAITSNQWNILEQCNYLRQLVELPEIEELSDDFYEMNLAEEMIQELAVQEGIVFVIDNGEHYLMTIENAVENDWVDNDQFYEEIEETIEDVDRIIQARIDYEIEEIENEGYMYLIQEQDNELYERIEDGLRDGTMYITANRGYYTTDTENIVHSDPIYQGEIEIQLSRSEFSHEKWYYLRLLARELVENTASFTVGSYDDDSILVYSPIYLTAEYRKF